MKNKINVRLRSDGKILRVTGFPQAIAEFCKLIGSVQLPRPTLKPASSAKTIEDWLQELSEPYRSAALKYAEKQGNLNRTARSLPSALAFKWDETAEGIDFWTEVCIALKYGYRLPPYPKSEPEPEAYSNNLGNDPNRAPDGFVMFGNGPLKVKATGKQYDDVAMFTTSPDCWLAGFRGNGSSVYALRKGSEIAKLNGLG